MISLGSLALVVSPWLQTALSYCECAALGKSGESRLRIVSVSALSE